jgi:hypothetical protein
VESFLLQPLLSFGFMGSVLAAVWLFARHQLQVQRKEWGALAEHRGLRLAEHRGLRQIVGELDELGVQVRVEQRGAGRSRQSYTVLRLDLNAPGPEGLRISREGLGDQLGKLLGGQDIEVGDPALDRQLRVKGADPQAVREVATPAVLQATLAMNARLDGHCRVEDGQVILEARGMLLRPRLDRLLEEGIELAGQWRAAFLEPWLAVTRRWRLTHRSEGSVHSLEGEVGPLLLSVRVDPRVERGPKTRIRLSLPEPLPGGLGLRARPAGQREGAGIGLGDPVLDSLLAATARDAERARRFIREADPGEDLHGKLLAVLHAWPLSTVGEQAVHLNAETCAAGELERQIEAALELGQALVRASRPA